MHTELKRLLEQIAREDVSVLEEKGKTYGDSWKRRGGVGAFMMLARKWDRLENVCRVFHWDVFDAVASDGEADAEGVLDDIADLRRYLLLVESEARTQMMDPFTAGAVRAMAKSDAEEVKQAMREHAASIRSQGE